MGVETIVLYVSIYKGNDTDIIDIRCDKSRHSCSDVTLLRSNKFSRCFKTTVISQSPEEIYNLGLCGQAVKNIYI